MEAELITKILAGGSGATIVIWFIYSMINGNKKKENKK